jgi:hypothetical protein
MKCPNSLFRKLRQLNLLTIPTAVSIACFDATFLVLAEFFGLTGRDIALGIIAGGAGGFTVLVAVLWQAARNVATSQHSIAL